MFQRQIQTAACKKLKVLHTVIILQHLIASFDTEEPYK